MKKFMRSLAGTGAAAVVGLCLMAASATAQVVDRDKTRPDTLKMFMSGDLVLDGVYRQKELTAFRGGATASVGTPPGNPFQGAQPPINERSETTYEGYVALRVAAEMSDKVSAVIEFGTKRQDNGFTNNFGNETTTGANASPVLRVREAHLALTDFLMADTVIQLGISTWSFNPTGRGGSMAFDLRGSQGINRNIDDGILAGNEVETTSEDQGVARFNRAANPDTMDPVGGVVTYKRDRMQIDVVLLPSVAEGGQSSRDQALYAADLLYSIDDKGSRLGLIAAMHAVNQNPAFAAGDNSPHETQFYTVGGGLSFRGIDGANMFIEGYSQFGDVGKLVIGGNQETIEMGGHAFQLGMHYAVPNSQNGLWFEVKYTLFSGDGDATTDGDDTVDRFAGYEGVEDTLIMESMVYGYDIDSNYNAVKISGGMSFSVMGRQNNLHVSAIFAHFTATEDIEFGGVVGGEDALGDEFDVKIKWDVSKQAAITLMGGWLTGSDVLEESMGGVGNPNSEDNTRLVVLGADLKF